ncbi:MAG: CBS domain-containing protein [bacterium]
MKLKEILKSKGAEVMTINGDATIHDAIKLLVEKNIGALLVMNKSGKPSGIISERDILRESAERDQQLRKTKIQNVMTRDLIIGLPDDDITYTMGVMTQNRIRHLPIMENEQVIGMISIGDVVKAQLNEQEFDNRYLKQYMFGQA